MPSDRFHPPRPTAFASWRKLKMSCTAEQTHFLENLRLTRLTQQRSLVKRRKQNLARNKQTCHGQDEAKRWVTADFANVCRRVSVKCNSTFCSDANLDYSIDSASLHNLEELYIRNFQPQICVRQWRSLKCLHLICRFQNGGYRKLLSRMSCCTNTKDPKEIKR